MTSPAGRATLAEARAELLADGGAAGEDGEFFRSGAFREAEGATHTLRVESDGRVASMPVIVREIPGSSRTDAVSLYGYPGAKVSGDGPVPEPGDVDWSATGLVSLFARERLDGVDFAGGAVELGTVLIHDPSKPREVRPRLAEQIRAAERHGYSTEPTPGLEAEDADIAGFHAAYTQTMRRVEATERYFFSEGYLGGALRFERSWLLVCRSSGGDVAAGAIAAVSDGYLHYFLGGTVDAAIDDSPFKCVVARMLDLADELELPLNLGGGVTAGDGLERFKRGFANASALFRTHQVVCDAPAYAELSGDAAGGDFFPAYRAGA
jgi:GNAT acetyltransferase-like protein